MRPTMVIARDLVVASTWSGTASALWGPSTLRGLWHHSAYPRRTPMVLTPTRSRSYQRIKYSGKEEELIRAHVEAGKSVTSDGAKEVLEKIKSLALHDHLNYTYGRTQTSMESKLRRERKKFDDLNSRRDSVSMNKRRDKVSATSASEAKVAASPTRDVAGEARSEALKDLLRKPASHFASALFSQSHIDILTPPSASSSSCDITTTSTITTTTESDSMQIHNPFDVAVKVTNVKAYLFRSTTSTGGSRIIGTINQNFKDFHIPANASAPFPPGDLVISCVKTGDMGDVFEVIAGKRRLQGMKMIITTDPGLGYQSEADCWVSGAEDGPSVSQRLAEELLKSEDGMRVDDSQETTSNERGGGV